MFAPAARPFAAVALALVVAGPLTAEEPPKGEQLKFTFDTSKVFPGTSRTVTVYVPKQYDGKTPACVYVNQDGVQFNAPAAFDRLIHEKAIPVVIGVFVPPGVVRPADGNALPRFNRSFEYDGLGDAYARFVLDEVLPAVERQRTADGRAIVLSKSGNDRAIGGSSSGAVCAFTAAWERPDAFSRVFSAIGTYVGLRGANVYPTLIRKVEPKAIRVFLQDGENDQNIYGGDWWMANQEMERSLTFAGYEVSHAWGKGGHNGADATKLFPEAMKWLWKDHPNPVKAGGGSSQLKEILLPGEGWQVAADGFQFTEGPAVNDKGEVFFNHVPASQTLRFGADGKAAVFVSDSKRGDGQAFGPDGRLYSVAAGSSQVIAYGPDGVGKVLADGFKGNDLVVRHDGGMYVTDPNTTPNKSQVWFVRPTGEKKVVDTGLKFSNGVCLSPDQSLLYVADSRSHWVYSYVVKGDGSLANKQKYFHLHAPDTADDSGVDGLRVDTAGRLWAATRLGLQVCDQAGRVNVIVPTPNGKCSNLTFGGPGFDTLYVTAGDTVYKRKVKAKGSNNYLPPTKPAPPRL